MGGEPAVSLATVAREWGRIGLTGFGGPPAHIALLRRLVTDERHWISSEEVEAAIAACNLLPGPASTQLAIFCAYRVAGRRGALVGGLAFIVPAVVIVTALSVLFLAGSPPRWIRGAGAGAGAAVAAVAVQAGLTLLRPSRRVASGVGRARLMRWAAYVVAGAAAAALVGPWLVLVLLGCGLVELGVSGTLPGPAATFAPHGAIPFVIGAASGVGGVSALAWVAIKVGLLSYGGGFVIIPLMQGDAVHTYHWMSEAGFLNAVALGQVTPGPVVATVAAVGYAAHGIGGAALASVIAFMPSFAFVLIGAGRFTTLRGDARAQRFLTGAGPATIGAILGASIPLAGALHATWQFVLLGAALVALVIFRRGVVSVLVGAGLIGTVIALAGGPLR